jgi:hypothetical protein
MLKSLIGFLLVLALLAGGIYWMIASAPDPDESGLAARQAIHEGMTWRQVVEAVKSPRKIRTMTLERSPDGTEEIVESGLTKYPGDEHFARWVDERLDHGFVFQYFFSAKTAFDVYFDAEGKVEMVTDAPTMADLLQTR